MRSLPVLFSLLFTLLTFTLMAQPVPDTPTWREIDSLIREGLIQTARERVENIREKAGQADLQVRASVYLAYLDGRESEDEAETTIERLRGELEFYPAGSAGRAVIHAALGQSYADYARNIYNRTDLSEDDDAALQTWSRERILRTATEQYLAAVAAPDALLAVDVSSWNELITSGNEAGRAARPTLYDLLMYQTIEYLQQAESMITEPTYAFNTDRPELFAPLNEFIAAPFATQDTASTMRRAILLFQDLLRRRQAAFRIDRRTLPALVEAELARLSFAQQQYTGKEELYLPALKQLEKTYPADGRIILDQARYWQQQANSYQEDDGKEADRLGYVTARNLVQSIVRGNYEKTVKSQAQVLLEELESETLGLQHEQVYLPDRPALVRVNFRNLREVFVRVIAVPEGEMNDRRRRIDANYIENKMRERPVQSSRISLPQTDDLRPHSTELALEALPLGSYLLLVSDNRNFNLIGGHVSPVYFWVSRLGLLTEQGYSSSPKNSGKPVFVLDRETGRPLAGVQVRTMSTNDVPAKLGTAVLTDEQGAAKYTAPERSSYRIRLERGEDRLITNQNFYNYSSGRPNEPETVVQTALFTDRAIYRPGQPLYFKGIVYRKQQGEEGKVAPNEKLTITLYDANGQEVDKQDVTTNAFGSVRGRFELPTGGLPGGFRLGSSLNGDTYFRLEEYKRPRFEVELLPNEDEPSLGQQVTVSGKATNYAGPAVAGARVSYTVVRQAVLPYYNYSYYRMDPFGGTETEAVLATGTTTTDEEGNFRIDYVAEAGQGEALRRGYFQFRTSVDVTDGTGETQTAQRSISLGKVPLLLQLDVPETVTRGRGDSILVTRTNLDRQPRTGAVSLSVYRALVPDRFLIDRYWVKPDKPLLDSVAFKRLFPHYAYGNEGDPRNYERGPRLTERPLRAGENGKTSLAANELALPVGVYWLEVTTQTEAGDPVTAQTLMTVIDPAARPALPVSQLFRLDAPDRTYVPGENAGVAILTSNESPYLLYNWRGDSRTIKYQGIDPTRTNRIERTIETDDRNGLSLLVRGVRYNRYFEQSETVSVPWQKDLTISVANLRDKMRPGEEAEVTVTITPPAGEELPAELLASMYDLSLDQFMQQAWSFKPYRSRQGYGYGSQLSIVDFGSDYGQDRGMGGGRQTETLNYNYPSLSLPFIGRSNRFRGEVAYSMNLSRADGPPPPAAAAGAPQPYGAKQENRMEDDAEIAENQAAYDQIRDDSVVSGGDQSTPPAPISPRTNLQETAFFYPQLLSKPDGSVELKFTAPEALTRWKLQLLAHNKTLAGGYAMRELTTQKELLVLPNAPRFLREGDRLDLTAKVSNTSEQALTGTVWLELFDPATDQSVNATYGLPARAEQNFTLVGGASMTPVWRVDVPAGAAGELGYRVLARSGDFTDGEQNRLPVLTNRVQVTDTKPFYLQPGEKRTVTLAGMGAASASRTSEVFTFELTSNPTWIGVKALPYLAEYPYDCTEQIANRLFANTLATRVVRPQPRIAEVFEQWRRDSECAEESVGGKRDP